MHIPRRSILSWCGALAVALTFGPPAAAQDPQVDPDSPAGTEYQLPIDRAREQAGGGTSSGKGGGAPLFGEGVDSRTSGGKPGSAEKRGSAEKPGSVSGARATAKAELGTGTPKIVQNGTKAPGGGTGIAAIGAGAAGVLLLGGLAGLAWRRRARPR